MAMGVADKTGLVLPSGRPNPYQQRQQAPTNPWGQIDPSQKLQGQYSGTVDQAFQGLNYAAQKGWGRALTQDEQNKIAQNAQAKGYAGGAVNQDHYNTALDFMTGMLGPQQQQTEGTPAQKTPTLGSESAIQQWQQQAPAAGVPASFRGMNPYAGQQQQLMSRILANPQTMGQQQQDQLNEAQKESATRMQRQMQGQGQQQMAGRGFGAGGGQEQQMNQQAQQNTMQQILSGRRDVAMKAAQQNRQDELGALDASQRLAGQEWDANMQGSQQALNQMNQNRSGNLNDFLGLHGADMDMLRLDEGRNQFNKTYGLDFLRYLQQGDQFNRSFGENQRQYNGTMGLNWSNAQSNQMQNWLNTLMGVF